MDEQKESSPSLSKGFTIIELIVVIAIIAILAAIVMVNVVGYINKSKDASIKAELNQIAFVFANYYSLNGVYYKTGDDNATTNSDYRNMKSAIEKNSGVVYANMYNAGGSYLYFCFDSSLNDGTSWCIDYTGYAGVEVAGNCSENGVCVGAGE